MIDHMTIPTIVVLCYFIITVIKPTKINNKWFPILSCILGVVIAILIYYVIPGFIRTSNIVDTIISGMTSGLAATGTNQIFKQLIKTEEEKNPPTEKKEKKPPKIRTTIPLKLTVRTIRTLISSLSFLSFNDMINTAQ